MFPALASQLQKDEPSSWVLEQVRPGLVFTVSELVPTREDERWQGVGARLLQTPRRPALGSPCWPFLLVSEPLAVHSDD